MFFGRSSENPTFIPHDQISTAVQDLIKETDRELVLVTPYFKPWNHLQTAIRAPEPVNADETVSSRNY
ncbi:hypothetical protein [Myxococcus xanthus]|uniref:Uncharacterized protein n=1 Tax=Myxococcus xanthus TaxID=34 RepID=A0A7Y4IIB1_MYXXA|nr:hypothetical protein [Myxococcus xanthus]NOJ79355.1 hypothetical protein [Myxococcus xanthus]NOJ84441.1 hypothetical protein [Myxococcus xanthus]